VAQHGELVAVADVTKDPRYGCHPVALKEPHAYICAPLRIRDEIIGVMTARWMAVKVFTENQCRIFETATRMIAIVIEKHRTQQENIRAQHLAAIATSLSEIAHYARNLMFAVRVTEANVGRAIERGVGMEGIRDSWEHLKRSNQKIRKLVDDMLNYSRDRDPQLDPANLNELVCRVVEDLQYHAQKHGVAITLDLDYDIPQALLDPSMIYDVLMNLVSNGIDAVPDGAPGQIVVRSLRSPDGGGFRIEVEDNGAGIPVSMQEKIFALFFSTKGERGTGVGLAASRKAIERHGGCIRFRTAEGKGTCFAVDLPLPAPSQEPAST
jgi:two-component system, NtrC family, sensor kinase